MALTGQDWECRRLLYARPGLRIFVATFLVMIAYGYSPLPPLVERSLLAERIMFVFAVTAMVLGWVWAARHPEAISSGRLWIARVSAVYLAISVPVYALQLSARLSLFIHPWVAAITRPWAGLHGGVLVGVAWLCSFSWRGRPRVAFVVASTLLLLVRTAGTWWI